MPFFFKTRFISLKDLSISVNIDATDISEGFFDAQIDISTNVGDIFIPVNLTVLNDLGLLGDLNNDSTVNVLDAIEAIDLVLYGDYNEVVDMSEMESASLELNDDFRICPTCSSKSLKTENGCDSCMSCGYSKCDK